MIKTASPARAKTSRQIRIILVLGPPEEIETARRGIFGFRDLLGSCNECRHLSSPSVELAAIPTDVTYDSQKDRAFRLPLLRVDKNLVTVILLEGFAKYPRPLQKPSFRRHMDLRILRYIGQPATFRYSIESDNPPWQPIHALDDGSNVYIEFPAGIGQGEIRLLTNGGYSHFSSLASAWQRR